MVSEVENILKGQLVRQANADKVIGVSTANLMPDEKGEVPLSKQSAFEVLSEGAPTLKAPAPDALTAPAASQEAPTLKAPAPDALTAPAASQEAPTLKAPAPDALTAPAVPQEAPALKAPAPDALTAPAAPQEAPSLQAPAPDALTAPAAPQEAPSLQAPAPDALTAPAAPQEVSVSDDVITEIPVDVVPPTALDGINLDLPSSDNNLEVEKVEEPLEEEISLSEEQVGLPETNEQVVAEEPSSVDNSLFVDTPNETPDLSGTSEQVDSLPTDSEIDEENEFSEEEAFEESPQAEEPENEMSKFDYAKLDLIIEELNKISASLGNLQKLGKISESLESLNKKFEETKAMLETFSLKVPEKNETISNQQEQSFFHAPVENDLAAPVVPEETSTLQAPAPDALTAPAAQLNTLQLEVPSLSETSLDVPEVGTSFQDPSAVIPAQEEMTDALSQLPGYDVSSVDETPIKGGMFV